MREGSSQTSSIVVGSVGISLVAAISIPALFSIYWKFNPRKEQQYEDAQGRYEDEDGVATAESQEKFEYSTTLPKVLILASSVIGLLVSIAVAVLSTVHPGRTLFVASWINFGTWALLVVQAINVFVERNPKNRYQLGIYGSLGSVVTISVLCAESGFLKSRTSIVHPYTAHIVLTAILLVNAIVLFVSFISFPRRPAVFKDGMAVDAQYTGSALGRYTFTWGADLLAFSKVNQGLDMKDLPRLAHYTRSENLQARFNGLKKRDRLWKQMIVAFGSAFVQQYLLVSITSVTQFAPQFAMFNLLKLLEQRSEGASIAAVAWAWVFGLGLSLLISSWIEAWLFWIIWSDLGIPMRSMLSALIFMKSTRRKDVKGVQKAKVETVVDASGTKPIINPSSGTKGEDTAPGANKDDEDEDESMQKSRQSTINLVGVDGKRISDFCSYSYIFPGVVIKLVVSMSFLVTLIGWKSLLAGLVVFFLSTPINIFISRKYQGAQGDLMKLRDQKMVTITEALQGIRQIKFSALERQWEAKIGEKRRQELTTQWRVFMLDVGLTSIWILGPVMLSAVSLAVYAIIHGDLSPSIAFTVIAVFGQIEGTLAIIPELTTIGLDAWVSLNRIEKYLDAPETVECTEKSDEIAFEKASVAWPSDSDEEDPDRFVLRDINIRFPNKELSVISGKTGSGKSLLLASILGEIDKMSGLIKVPRAPSLYDRYDHKATKGNWVIESAIAFVAQIPWIENATIKNNILFGLPCDDGRYKKVLSVCALEKDLDMLPDGELTEIGANGINLSGGQRWRVSFARALYSRAGILILDDIFSAVDAHVGRQLFEDALTGELGTGRTRILVTHHIGLCLPKTKYTVILSEGTIEHAGTVEDLERTGSLADILKQEQEAEREDAQENGLLKVESTNGDTLQKVISHRSERSAKIDDGELDSKGKSQPKKFTEDEKRETGSVKLDIYKEYIKNSGSFWVWGPLLFLYLCFEALVLGRSWWISLWTRSYQTESFFANHLHNQYTVSMQSIHATSDAEGSGELWFYLCIYVGLSIGICIMGTLRTFTVFLAAIKASKIMFEKLTYTVLRAPLRWLDTVPVGRVLNRFTADFNVLDSRIAYNLGFGMWQFLELLGIMVAGIFVSPFVLLFAIVLLGICVLIAKHYLLGAREVKRLESNAKSPIFEQFGSALAGVGTIRAFGKADEYVERMFTKVDDHARAFWHIWVFNRWMGFRLNVVGACFAIIVAAIIVSAKGIDASLAGFALAFSLQYTTAIIWSLRSYANIELDMNAAERIVEYSCLDTEDQSGNDVPAAWPTEGRLEVDGIVAGYAADLPPVLKGLSFKVEKNQRVGVVGRTGAGKSSLTLALFRFLEPREGSIHIDSIDIAKIKLHDLRSRLAIIPQDPVLFSGTVRSNLDAFDEHTDADLRDALERVHLVSSTGLASRDESAQPSGGDSGSGGGSGSVSPARPVDTNTNIFNSLTSRISEGGLNLSQGQRQLLCLARAIVSRPKIMVLDEATSAVDMATDVLIQRSIREEFGESTLLVIAHRLSTIADFDRILVMSDGRAVEFDEPRKLMEKRGVFWEMVGQSGEKERLEEIIRLGNRESGERGREGAR